MKLLHIRHGVRNEKYQYCLFSSSAVVIVKYNLIFTIRMSMVLVGVILEE